MAFNKYANAQIVKPSINFQGWDEIRQKANATGFNQREATKVVLQKYDPQEFLLTHCTIIASVDTEQVKTASLGRQVVDGFQIDRKYADYHVSPQTLKYINNNNDCWERKLLLAAFRTFTGGENYVEHIQIPELSKGKIIDAAARDIGDSIYVDILVATNRKHRPLIAAIKNGSLSTLSMGCFVPGTPVTMADGTRLPIEEVSPGDFVITHKGRVREVLNKQIRGGKWGMKRIKVVGVSDAIEATDNHPFFVIRPARECACGCGELLRSGDKDPVRRLTKRFKTGHDKRILNPNGTYSLEELRERQNRLKEIQGLRVEEVRADELRPGDYVVFPKFDFEEKTTTPEAGQARLLGYYLAEGSFLKYKGEPTEVQFNFSLQEQSTFVEEVVTLLREVFPGCAPWVQTREDRNTCTVHVYGREIAAWFRKHGGEYSHRKRLSGEAMRWSIASQRELLGAWLNGDGHANASNGATVGTTTSYDLACQLHALSIRCGLAVRVACVFGGKSVSFAEAVVGGLVQRHAETGRLAVFNLYYSKQAHHLSDVCSKAPQVGQHQNLRVLDDKVIFPIGEIEDFVYEGFVHDMEVEEDHSYLVHGLAVHNCQVQFTICTKCGNVAYDETQLCPHIKYAKGNDFFDEFGQKKKVAELCGHISEEPGSVRFIEASWVANPAFRGAVLRNILSPEDIANLGGKMAAAFAEAPRVGAPGSLQKAASVLEIAGVPGYVRTILGQDFGMDDVAPPGDASPKKEEKSDDDPIRKVVDDLTNTVREQVTKRIREDMGKSEVQVIKNLNENQNDTLIKSAMEFPEWRKIAEKVVTLTRDPKVARKILSGLILYKNGGWSTLVKTGSFSGRELLSIARVLDLMTQRTVKAGDTRLYRIVLAVGGMAPYPDIESYLAACRQVVGRDLSSDEVSSLIDRGRLFALGS